MIALDVPDDARWVELVNRLLRPGADPRDKRLQAVRRVDRGLTEKRWAQHKRAYGGLDSPESMAAWDCASQEVTVGAVRNLGFYGIRLLKGVGQISAQLFCEEFGIPIPGREPALRPTHCPDCGQPLGDAQ